MSSGEPQPTGWEPLIYSIPLKKAVVKTKKLNRIVKYDHSTDNQDGGVKWGRSGQVARCIVCIHSDICILNFYKVAFLFINWLASNRNSDTILLWTILVEFLLLGYTNLHNTWDSQVYPLLLWDPQPIVICQTQWSRGRNDELKSSPQKGKYDW